MDEFEYHDYEMSDEDWENLEKYHEKIDTVINFINRKYNETGEMPDEATTLEALDFGDDWDLIDEAYRIYWDEKHYENGEW
jgi:hypothetical protein